MTRTSGRFTVQYIPTPVPGPVGLTPRLSVWKAGQHYRNDTDATDVSPRYVDYVTDVDVALLGETEYHVYRCVKTHYSDNTTKKPGNTTYWREISSGYGPLIAPLLLSRKIIADFIDVTSLAADSAFIDNLTVKLLDTLPTETGSKIRVIGNEFQVLDDTGLPVVRVYGGDMPGGTGFGTHILDGEVYDIFPENDQNIHITSGSNSFDIDGSYTYRFNGGDPLTQGTVLSKQSTFGVLFRLDIPRHAARTGYAYGSYTVMTEYDVYLQDMTIKLSARLVTGSGNVITSFENETAQWPVTAIAHYDNAHFTPTISKNFSFNDYTLQQDDTVRLVVYYQITGHLENIIQRNDVIDVSTPNGNYLYMGVLKAQEAAMTEIADGKIFFRLADGVGYGVMSRDSGGLLSSGGMLFRYKGSSSSSLSNRIFCIGLDNEGLFALTGSEATKRYIDVDSSTGVLKISS